MGVHQVVAAFRGGTLSPPVTTGRFAPSPTGPLHLGNLRTALVAHLSALSTSGRFLVRFEDLDPAASRRDLAQSQLADLAAIGIVPSEQPVWQSERFDRYDAALAALARDGRVYECFCSRSEIRAAVAAPHSPDRAYPGTCRELPEAERTRRRRERRPALRLLSDNTDRRFIDAIHGAVNFPVTDIVLRRNDGLPAYNLAVVVDDAEQEVTEVVRGEDLRAVTASQIALQELLGYPRPQYLHVPLVVGPDGERLAKRHGAVTLSELVDAGWSAGPVRDMLLASLGQREGEPFDPAAIPRDRWLFDGSRAVSDKM